MTDSPPPLPRIALVLGFAGLAPQVWALLATFREADRYIGLAAGYFYAALIFSFLGGLGWGVAASRKDAPEWLYLAAVVPSLIAFATGIPWMTGATWPGPSLAVLGFCILISTFVDRTIFKAGLIDRSLLRLRFGLSLGLGALTLLLAAR
jgi:Protein of unknown function (DUF3429)